jgi:MFS family permease
VAAIGLFAGGVLMLLVGVVATSGAWLVPLFALAGFALGATGPSRDMIVRGATPPGASGRVYGFVYSGLDLGSTVAPVAIGALLDHGEPQALFIAVAVFLFLAIGTVLQVRRSARAAAPSPHAAD